MTFKDLNKKIGISNQQQQQTQYLDKLQDKPFWIWSIEEHKQAIPKRHVSLISFEGNKIMQ